MNPHNFAENVEFLLDCGESPHVICNRHGLQYRYMAHWLKRAGREDLWERIMREGANS